MRRLILALSVLVVGVVVSSCAVGVRQPATDITDSSATLNGKVLSTTGGAGSYYFEYGPTEARTERTPTRDIDFVVNESEPVSEPIDGLEPATTYHYAVCAEDSENPGDPFCSPDATFSTGDSVVGQARQCAGGTEPPCADFGGLGPIQDILTADAHSTAAGDDPSGTLDVRFSAASRGSSGFVTDVTCLHVADNVGIIGGLGQHFGPFEADNYPAALVVRVTDGGGPGSRQDTWEILFSEGEDGAPPPPAPTNCPTFVDAPPGPNPGVNQEGDLAVTDAQPDSTPTTR